MFFRNGIFMYGLFQSMSKSKDRDEDKVEVIDCDSDNEDQFEDASDSINEREGPNDLTRPSEWRPRGEMDREAEPVADTSDDVLKDSLGELSSDTISNERIILIFKKSLLGFFPISV